MPRASNEALAGRIGAHLGNVRRDLEMMIASLERAGFPDAARYAQVALLGCDAARMDIACQVHVPAGKKVRWQF